ncbi:hypothetical protein HDU78_011504, partial [Chytriomyces hyalinus]
MPLCFPTLFPFGGGGPSMDREVHLSPRRWVKRCLKLYEGNFQTHWGFTAVAYDYIATNEAFSKQYLSMQLQKSAILEGNWSMEDIRMCYQHSQTLEICQQRGISAPQTPDIVTRLLDIKKRIIPGLHAYIGSDKSRSAHLHVAFGIQKRLGSANVFITVSPASSRSWALAINCKLVNGEHIQLQSLPDADVQLNTPNASERENAANKNSYECADYARRNLLVFLEDFLGWNFKYRAPNRGGGFLGVTRWFTTSAETQKK